jgi:hypothetical protein
MNEGAPGVDMPDMPGMFGRMLGINKRPKTKK